MNLILLFFEFAKFGALAIGGGFTILPLLFETFVNQKGLFTAAGFGNLISLSQMTPGPMTINIATFAGYLTGGIPSAVMASLGLIFPSLLMTGTALFFFTRYRHSWLIKGFLKGAHLVAFVMVLYAVVLFGNMSVFSSPWPIKDILKTIVSGHFVGPKGYHVNGPEFVVFVISFYLMKRGISVTHLLVGSAIVGCGLSFL